MQAGRSVRKKRASKVKAIEELAEEIIQFSEPIASLSAKVVAEKATQPEATGNEAGPREQYQPEENTRHVKAQKRLPGEMSDSSGKKVLFLYLVNVTSSTHDSGLLSTVNCTTG